MAQQSGNNLKTVMEKLLQAFEDEVDRDLLHRVELDHIFRILKANKERITLEPPEVEKKEKLPELLRNIDDALQQSKARSVAKSKTKMAMPSVSDCNPFKSRSSSSQQLSVEPLLQQTIAILGDVPPPSPPTNLQDEGEETVTEYYEWTTSYVDESRIYGWEDMANQVVDALVGGVEEDDDEEVLFRTAGIAGIHGSGKTALAQKVFVHDRIKDAFPLRLWVCVGPPDHEDRFNLLYRMLDNLGLDTAKVEAIVDKADVVVNKAESPEDKERSKIGVLLFILYVTLYKTGYLIVFDDMRAYDDWYSNLTLPPPKDGEEWYDRLAYGLPKARKSAVLVTCRSEDGARVMVRTGGVFRPPKLGDEEGWKLFDREYKEAKKKSKGEKKGEEEDKLFRELEGMKKEIVGKCLGLPVAIVQAAKGFAALDHEPDAAEVKEDKAAADQIQTEPAAEIRTEATNQSAAN